MRNKLVILCIITAIVCAGLFSFVVIDKDNTIENSDVMHATQNNETNENEIDSNNISDNSRISPKFNNVDDIDRYIFENTKDLYPDFDEELSKKVYDNLSEEERLLQEYTSNSVGYKKLTSEQLGELKKIKDEEKEAGVVFAFKEMTAIGETNSLNTLTADDINELIKNLNGKNDIDKYVAVERFLRMNNFYPDIIGGSGTTIAHYYIYSNNEKNITAGILVNSTLKNICIMSPDGNSINIQV